MKGSRRREVEQQRRAADREEIMVESNFNPSWRSEGGEGEVNTCG